MKTLSSDLNMNSFIPVKLTLSSYMGLMTSRNPVGW